MTTRLPHITNGVLVDGVVAAQLLKMLAPALSRYRSGGVTFDARLQRTLEALQAAARIARAEAPQLALPQTWIAAAVAADLLGVSAQAVRDMGKAGRLPVLVDGRKVYVDQGAVITLAELRNASQAKVRKGSQSADSASEPRLSA